MQIFVNDDSEPIHVIPVPGRFQIMCRSFPTNFREETSNSGRVKADSILSSETSFSENDVFRRVLSLKVSPMDSAQNFGSDDHFLGLEVVPEYLPCTGRKWRRFHNLQEIYIYLS